MEFVLEKTQKKPTLYTIKNGDRFYLHHPEDPETQACEWIKGFRYTPDSLVVLYGLGLGYELREILRRLSPQDKIIAVEPSEQCKQLFIEYNPDLCAQRKHQIYCVTSWEEFKLLFLRIGDWENLITAAIPAFAELYKEECAHLFSMIARELNNLQADQATTDYFAQKWQKNVLMNLRHISKAGSAVSVIGKYRGPAILVAAGPSLQKNIELLSQVRGKALIAATQTTNRVFEKRDEKPDLIFSFDGDFINYYEHFDGVSLEIPLVFDTTLYWKAVESWRGPLSIFLVHPGNKWIEERLEVTMSGLMSGPSITNTIFDFFLEIGADPIILIGQDLAYTGGRFHYPGTHRSEVWDSTIPPERRLVSVAGQHGDTVISDKAMLAHLHWYEEVIRVKAMGRIIINASEGGANIVGATNMTLESAIEKYCQADNPLVATIVEQMTTPAPWNTANLKAYLKEAKEKLIDLLPHVSRGSQVATDLVCYAANSKPDIPRHKRILKELAEIDGQIQGAKEYLNLAHYMLRPLLRGGGTIDRAERLKTAQRSLQVYNGIQQAISYVVPLLEEDILP